MVETTASPSLLQTGVEVFVDKFTSVNAQPHEHKSGLVGASCLLFAIPAVLARAHGDQANFMWLMAVTGCSFLGDYACLGTAWNVIDRWMATTYTMALSAQCFRKVPLLTVLNVFPVLGVLAWARNSRTEDEWRIRQSAWHLAMCCDISFFLTRLYAR
mmetsp:Transcript_24188/g.38652  ORF Transcript_24188/g.38652 Transcript_24188/m.38652 type:complete len:158 (-) Transcript_24188:43-516(-)|eukprot:CAMPEP_0169265288 /NCGR_PEP_ID=MMETSP1016-20121227/45664_1 /TAXON_ID=342587 /ORGANISM="Karlodinium micrum, Strain CCMP2283" /LENGTH=157 /DNA_ID=CAMNT_0009348877 /DNA_START=61 /DNA_END=534 /DNA_ORIENTATION=-